MKLVLRPLVLAALTLTACGGGEEKVKAPVVEETPADEVLRIGATWTSTQPDQGLLSPPSPISMFRNQRTSQVTLERHRATEELVLDEELDLRDGTRVKCHSVVQNELKIRWGRRNGEAAVELVRPALQVARSCSGTHPEAVLSEPAVRALLVLRSDQLVVVEPTTDKRTYIPQAY